MNRSRPRSSTIWLQSDENCRISPHSDFSCERIVRWPRIIPSCGHGFLHRYSGVNNSVYRRWSGRSGTRRRPQECAMVSAGKSMWQLGRHLLCVRHPISRVICSFCIFSIIDCIELLHFAHCTIVRKLNCKIIEKHNALLNASSG